MVPIFVFVKLDQVPIVPGSFRHGLIAILKDRVAEAIAVSFEAGHLAGFAADAGTRIYEPLYGLDRKSLEQDAGLMLQKQRKLFVF